MPQKAKTAAEKKSRPGPGIFDARVEEKTGRTPAAWFQMIDKAGGAKLTHTEIARLLWEKHKLEGWWAQMVTVAYERARGRRVVNQRPGGFEFTASRTVDVPLEDLYHAWNDAALRRRWLGSAEITVRKANKNRSMRITWDTDGTNLDVGFYAKGDAKSQVAAQHGKLADAKAAAKMKAYWTERLDELKRMLEKTRPRNSDA
jgi:uncharacterized protein YndB with AHSA1/START domain